MSNTSAEYRTLHGEQAALGCVIWDPATLTILRQLLKPEDLGYEPHRAIFDAMCSLADDGKDPNDLYLLIKALERRAINTSDATKMVNDLTDAVSADPEGRVKAGNAAIYAREVLQAAVQSTHDELARWHAEIAHQRGPHRAVASAGIAAATARLADLERRIARDDSPEAVDEPELLGVDLADVEVEDFHWVWHRRIALGKLTMFDGDPGYGKSLTTLDIAARVVMGECMPDGTPGLDAPAGVVLICGEDGLGDTVKPRMLAAGASPESLRRVRVINQVPRRNSDGTTTDFMLSLLADLPKIEATIRAKSAKLLIIDPITAYLGNGTDMYKDSDLRQVLTPLALMAERTGVAVIPVRHLNKSSSTPALHRGLGGVGFIGVARLGLLFAPNPDAEGEILVSRHKGNIGAPPPTLAYRIVQVGEAENMPRIQWQEGERAMTAGEALAAQSGAGVAEETRSAIDEAIGWLCAYLADGPQPAKETKAAARADDISEKTLRTARLRICKKPDKEGMRGGWKWELDPAKLPSSLAEGIFGANNAASPDFKPTQMKMPMPDDVGHLRTETPPKMPSKSEAGHLRIEPAFNGLDDTTESSILPKMPSAMDKGILADTITTDEDGFADVEAPGNGDAA